MKNILKLMNGMKKEGLIKDYALFGAMAVAMYDEAISTMDFDMVVAMEQDGFVNMAPIYQYIVNAGYRMEGLHFIIGDVPLDIVVIKNDPNDILYDALKHAQSIKTDIGTAKVFTPDYLAAIALSVGRKKDYRKVDLLLNSITSDFSRILKKYGLTKKWNDYKKGKL